MASPYPLVNGLYPAWADLELVIKAAGMPAFKTGDFIAFSAKETLDPGQVRGNGAVKRGTTVGEYNAEGSISLLMLQGQLLRQRLGNVAKLRKIPIGAVQFEINASWKLPGLMGAFVKCQLTGCRIKEGSYDGSPSTDGAALVFPLDAHLCRFGGKALIEY